MVAVIRSRMGTDTPVCLGSQARASGTDPPLGAMCKKVDCSCAASLLATLMRAARTGCSELGSHQQRTLASPSAARRETGTGTRCCCAGLSGLASHSERSRPPLPASMRGLARSLVRICRTHTIPRCRDQTDRVEGALSGDTPTSRIIGCPHQSIQVPPYPGTPR
jgi:hypothetical protein